MSGSSCVSPGTRSKVTKRKPRASMALTMSGSAALVTAPDVLDSCNQMIDTGVKTPRISSSVSSFWSCTALLEGWLVAIHIRTLSDDSADATPRVQASRGRSHVPGGNPTDVEITVLVSAMTRSVHPRGDERRGARRNRARGDHGRARTPCEAQGGQYDLVVTTALDDMGLACWLWTGHPCVVGIEFDFGLILDATLGDSFRER